MKILDIITGEKPSLSFEVFPPKTSATYESVRSAAEAIADLHPSYMSVTYGAGGGTSAYTMDIAQCIQAKGVPSLAHLSMCWRCAATFRTGWTWTIWNIIMPAS